MHPSEDAGFSQALEWLNRTKVRTAVRELLLVEWPFTIIDVAHTCTLAHTAFCQVQDEMVQ